MLVGVGWVWVVGSFESGGQRFFFSMLPDKHHFFKNSVNLYNIDIICITETKLNFTHLDAEIMIPNFVHYRGDRNFKIDDENSNDISDWG